MDLDLVVVGGGGHVGLPLALAFARAGQRVGIYDVDKAKLEAIASGVMPFREAGADALLREMLSADRLEFSSTPDIIAKTDRVVIVIGTPIDEFMSPSVNVFEHAVSDLAPHLRRDALVVLRSTVYPGTTEYVARTLADRGIEADLSFCPERIVEGRALEELTELPQIIGADNDRAGARAEALFRLLGTAIVRTNAKEAELAKLFTNTWRYMKFAVGNQFFMIADAAGVDYDRVLRAIRYQYPRAADLPGPGFSAGPCLLKDTMQLAAFTSDHFPMGQSAMQVNEGLPAYLVSAIEQRYGSLRGRCIGILGMAFKPDSDDPRASLSYKVRKLLSWTGARVLCTDPYVVDERLSPLQQVLDQSEILVVGVPHSAYRSLDLRGRVLVDIWGSLSGAIRI